MDTAADFQTRTVYFSTVSFPNGSWVKARFGAAPTPAPTFGSADVVPVAGDEVCGPELLLNSRRDRKLATADEESGRSKHLDRELATWTQDSCYYACRERLGNPPTVRVIS